MKFVVYVKILYMKPQLWQGRWMLLENVVNPNTILCGNYSFFCRGSDEGWSVSGLHVWLIG